MRRPTELGWIVALSIVTSVLCFAAVYLILK